MKNVIRTTTSGFKNKVRGGGVLSKTLLTTAVFAALAATSAAASAAESWYFGNYGVALDSANPFGWSGTVKSTTTGNATWTLTASSGGANTNSSIVLGTITNPLGLSYTTYDTTPAKNYLNLTGTVTGVTGLSVLTFNTTETSGTPIKIGLSGIQINGGLDLTAKYGTEDPASEAFSGWTGQVTVLDVAAGGSNATVAVTNNSGIVNVNFAAMGTSVVGLNIGQNTNNASTWTGKTAETYTVSSNLSATAVNVLGEGTWEDNFSASALSTGVGDTVPSETFTPGKAVAVSVGGTGGSTDVTQGTWQKAFTATATASGLSPSAIAVDVGALSTATPLNIGNGGAITITSVLTTAAAQEFVTTGQFAATGVNFEGAESAKGYIGVTSPAITTPTTAGLNTSTVNIGATLNIQNNGDLINNSKTLTAIGALATGVLMNTKSGALNILTGSGTENSITATVNGGALTTEATAGWGTTQVL